MTKGHGTQIAHEPDDVPASVCDRILIVRSLKPLTGFDVLAQIDLRYADQPIGQGPGLRVTKASDLFVLASARERVMECRRFERLPTAKSKSSSPLYFR